MVGLFPLNKTHHASLIGLYWHDTGICVGARARHTFPKVPPCWSLLLLLSMPISRRHKQTQTTFSYYSYIATYIYYLIVMQTGLFVGCVSPTSQYLFTFTLRAFLRCFVRSLLLFLLLSTSAWCFCVWCLLQVPSYKFFVSCLQSPVVDMFFAFLIWTLLYGCTLSCCFVATCIQLLLNKSLPLVPPQPCLMSYE